MTYMERIRMSYGEEGEKAMQELIAFGHLDKDADKNASEREAWETMWCIFKDSTQGRLALRIYGREGDW